MHDPFSLGLPMGMTKDRLTRMCLGDDAEFLFLFLILNASRLLGRSLWLVEFEVDEFSCVQR